MSRRNKSPPTQTSLFAAFEQAEREALTAHLPATMDEGIAYCHSIIERHHAAMLHCDFETARTFYTEAHELAVKLNGGESGIFAHRDSSGYVLARETAAPLGAVPLYGQTGDFILDLDGTPVRIEMDGLFGIGGYWMILPGFAVHAVDYDKPFLSETGYRSFISYRVNLEPGTTPEALVRQVLRSYRQNELKDKLKPIDPVYVERHAAANEPSP